MPIHYINTDLEVSEFDLAALAAALETLGLFALHAEMGEDRVWRGRFETETQHDNPETTIALMLAAIERLGAPALADWRRSNLREFNIGYSSGDAPKVLEQSLSNQLVHRIAAVGARLGISIYSIEGV